MYLFFDTETTGLPLNYKATVTDTRNWPRLVQLAWMSYNEKGELQSTGDRIIKPNGFIIPEEASRVHRITQERADQEGESLYTVINEFSSLLSQHKYAVAHNISFDEKIMGCEFYRMGIADPLPYMNRLCTMEASTNFCKISGPYGYKWPRLQELHKALFSEEFAAAHNAAADIHATAKCFWEMKNRGIAFQNV